MSSTNWDIAFKLAQISIANNIELSKSHTILPKKILILFDMNGTLLYRSKTLLDTRIQHAFVYNQQYYYYRPYAQNLITWLIEEYSHLVNIAFYTSMSYKNAHAGAMYLTANTRTKVYLYDQVCNKSDPLGEISLLYFTLLRLLYFCILIFALPYYISLSLALVHLFT